MKKGENLKLIPPKRKKELSAKGGRNKKGKKHKTTIEREKVLEMAKDLVAGRTRKLIDTQSILAMGAIKIFKIHMHWEGSGKKKSLIRDKPEIVENEEEIIHVLDHEYGSGAMGDPNDHDDEDQEYDYFFVMTKDPDNQAIKDLLDRTFGKATENKNLTIEKGMGELLDELEEND